MKYSLKIIVVLLFILFSAFVLNNSKFKKAKKLHFELLTIDTHTDSPLNLLSEGFDIAEEHDANEAKIDIPKMEKGGLDAAFFAVFTSQLPRTEENTEKTYRLAHQIIDSVYSISERYNHKLELAFHNSDALRIEKTGKRAIYLGMENGFPIGNVLGRVEEFYKRGVRYITLSHSSNNDICDSSTDKGGSEHNGLSNFGYEVVAEMNRLGMMIDVSHISDSAFFDVINTSKTPVFASHSSVRSLCNHPRNMSDTMIKALAANGGVIQICILGAYISPEDSNSVNYIKHVELREKYNNYEFKDEAERKQAWSEWEAIERDYPPILPTVAQAVDHIDYVVKLVGIDYVGIGTDFDGGGGLADCKDASELPNITYELLKRGYTPEEIQKIWSGNFIRVFKQVESFPLQNN
ncbi:MAG: dipeptidase [Bacteroidales bacterium]|nr:dipeptidase [Bacteroidales bacterium]MBN2818113.1 dipeptidase [Bacteroidales bacterium]